MGIAFKAGPQFPEKVGFALEGMDAKGALLRQEPWKKHSQECLH